MTPIPIRRPPANLVTWTTGATRNSNGEPSEVHHTMYDPSTAGVKVAASERPAVVTFAEGLESKRTSWPLGSATAHCPVLPSVIQMPTSAPLARVTSLVDPSALWVGASRTPLKEFIVE
jgi:hypothetical protein